MVGCPGGEIVGLGRPLSRSEDRTKIAGKIKIVAALPQSFPKYRVAAIRRLLRALFGGAVGKDTVSRVWRKVKGDWEAWNARSLAEEPIVRLILDGT